MYIKPYTVQAQWIMSEKYKGVAVIFWLRYIGRPGHKTANGEYVYLDSYPQLAGRCDAEPCIVSYITCFDPVE